MRAKEILNKQQGVAEGNLNEIYKMPPTKNSSQGMTVWAYNDAIEKKSPVVYQKNNVVIFRANNDLLRYIILQDNQPVLYIGFTKFLDGYKSGTVATEMIGRGKGLAQQAYLNASNILGVPIYSDSTQTDASRLGIWNKLIQQYPNRVVGYDQKSGRDLPLEITDQGPAVNQNQPIYVDRKSSKNNKPIGLNDRSRTRLLKLLPNTQQDVAEGSLNEFAPGGFNGGDDDEFSPVIAKIAEEDGFTKGVVLADGATLELAITINQWHNQHGGMYKQYFAKGFKEGRMEKIRYDNKQYNLNLKLMKDGSIRHGEQGLAEGLNEFATGSGGGGKDDILKTLAAQWLNGDVASGDLDSDIQSQEKVERRLAQGIICPDGVKRKLYIDFSDDYEGVVIYSDDDWSITYKRDDLTESKQGVAEDWSEKYKKSINCKNPKGFSQRAHCQGRKKNNEEIELEERKRKRKKKTARYYYGPAYYYGATDTGAEDGDGGGLEEDWKKSLANIGLAGAIGLGAAGGMALKDKVKSAFTKPTAQVTQPVQTSQQAQPQPQEIFVSPITSNPLELKLLNTAKQAGLTGMELAQFLGQCAHETLDYNRMVERGSKKYFNKYEPKFLPRKAKILGNVKPGDGERYKGRGYIQLTGRYNYKIAGQALNLPLEQNPDLAAQPDIAAKIALWYWSQRVRPEVENFADTTSVTRKINPGLSGLEDRHQNFVSYIAQRDD